MSSPFNIYCDESCHLERDDIPVMVLGAVACPDAIHKKLTRDLRSIIRNHALDSAFEVKWTKVSKAKSDFYLEVVDWFFDRRELSFRCVVTQKSSLNHEAYKQTHDDFYYKQWFLLLSRMLRPSRPHRIYLDMKDTRSEWRARKLRDSLCNAAYDFDRSMVDRIQHVRSHEVALLQLADLLTGAVAYANRELANNQGKVQIVERMRQRSGWSLTKTTLIREEKFNILVWHSRESLL